MRLCALILAFAGLAAGQAVTNPSNPTNTPNQVNVTTSWLYANKMRYAGAWSSTATYGAQDTVTYSGSTYVSLQAGNLNQTPSSSQSYWTPIGGGDGGGGTIPATTNVLKGDGAGNASDAGIAPANLATLSGGGAVTGYLNFATGRLRLPDATFTSPPSSPLTGQVFRFTDASAAGTCTGGGSSVALCYYTGSAFASIGGGGGGQGSAFTSYSSVSGTPAFAISANTSVQELSINLAGNVTSSTLDVSNASPAETVVIKICQPGAGNKTWVYPPNVTGGATPPLAANACIRQTFSFDGINVNANAPGIPVGIAPTIISGPERTLTTGTDCAAAGSQTMVFDAATHRLDGCGNGGTSIHGTVFDSTLHSNQFLRYIAAGGIQTFASIADADLPTAALTDSKTFDNDTQSATALAAGQVSGRFVVPVASTLVEVDVMGGTGSPGSISYTGTSSFNIRKIHGGTATTLLSGALATVSGYACALPATSGTCAFNNSMTSSSSITISTTAIAAGDIIEVSAFTPDTAQTWYAITPVWVKN